jgi:hypothetical protein
VACAVAVVDARQWAQREFGSVDLGDQRLTRRAVKVAWAMAGDPPGSIPKQNKRWKQTKGAYRLFDHERATFESMLQPHWQQTRGEAGQANQGRPGEVVLMIQDTTELDYTSHPRTEGLGRFGKGPIWQSGRGMLLHNVLAVRVPQHEGDPPRVLGLGWSKLWCRSEPVRDPKRKRNQWKKSGPSESARWTEAVDQIGPPPPGAGVTWVHVGDREADIFDLYERCTSQPGLGLGLGFVVRVVQPRKALCGHDEVEQEGAIKSKDRPKQSLQEAARAAPEVGEKTLWVAGRGNRAGREAKLRVSAAPVTLYSPWRDSRTARTLRLWVVRVWEVDAPADVEEPIEWILLTNLPTGDAAGALRIASWYSLRWTIEEYHKCLKSGCRVEERQLESAQRLAPLIGMLSAVAVRLLQLKHDVRAMPDRPALRCVPQAQVRTLAAYLKTSPGKLTVRQFAHETARLGGFVGRKSDGEPGWQTLWRGWHELELMTLGYRLATGPPRCG